MTSRPDETAENQHDTISNQSQPAPESSWLVAGSGKRLFGASDGQLPLKLLDSATFRSGVIHLTYAKV